MCVIVCYCMFLFWFLVFINKLVCLFKNSINHPKTPIVRLSVCPFLSFSVSPLKLPHASHIWKISIGCTLNTTINVASSIDTNFNSPNVELVGEVVKKPAAHLLWRCTTCQDIGILIESHVLAIIAQTLICIWALVPKFLSRKLVDIVLAKPITPLWIYYSNSIHYRQRDESSWLSPFGVELRIYSGGLPTANYSIRFCYQIKVVYTLFRDLLTDNIRPPVHRCTSFKAEISYHTGQNRYWIIQNLIWIECVWFWRSLLQNYWRL